MEMKKIEPIKLTEEEADMLIGEINNVHLRERWKHCPFQWRWNKEPQYTSAVRRVDRHCIGFCGALFPEIGLRTKKDWISQSCSCPNGCDEHPHEIKVGTINRRVIAELRHQDWIE